MPPEKDDNDLYWEKIRNGDQESLFALYNNNYFPLVRFGLKLSGEDELVKDCVTQLFLQLWDKKEALPPVQNVRAYLFTTLKRLMLNEWSNRSKMDNAVQKMKTTMSLEELSYEEMIIHVQQNEETKRKLHQALQQLTPRQMELIRLKFFEELSYEEIAAQTSQSIKTAYNTVYDAIKLLRKLLK